MATILIVDDTTLIRDLIQASLSNQGFNFLSAATGREALEVMQRQLPDLILLDVIMPELDGLGFLRVIRNNPQYRNIPVILLTSAADRDSVIQAAKLGVRDYLLKSQTHLQQMASRISFYLDGGQPVRRLLLASSPPDQPGRLTVAQASAGGSSQAGVQSPAIRPVTAAPEASCGGTPRPAQQSCSPASKLKELSELTPIITKNELIRLVNEGLQLRPLAPVVQTVMSATANPHCSAEDLARAVSQDQALCIRILKLSNSSVYHRGRSVDNIKAAVGRLGVCEIRNLVMALGVLQQYEGRISERLDARLFWEHSIACGLIASGVAREVGIESVDDFFLWGLLHDMGRLILAEHASDKYAQVWDVAESLGVPLEAVEAKLLMLDHCSILERALEHWKFPRDFITPVVNHHKSAANIKRLGPSHVRAAAIVALSDRLAHSLVMGSSGNDDLGSLDDLFNLTGVQPGMLDGIEKAIQDQTNDLKCSLLMRTNSTTWPNRAADLRTKLPDNLKVACISSEPKLDPLRMFFARISDVCNSERPDLAVIYMPDCRRLAEQLAALGSWENESDLGPVPVVLAYDKGQPNDPRLEQRQFAALRMPVRVDDLVTAINSLTAGTRETIHLPEPAAVA